LPWRGPTMDQNNTLLSRPLPLKMFSHASLPGAAEELRFFKRKADVFRVEGPWPPVENGVARFVASIGRVVNWLTPGAKGDRGVQETPARTIARHMRNPGLGFDGRTRAVPDQIQHFSCHCHSSRKHRGSYILTMRGDGGSVKTVEMTDL